jgi:hypothetical protein
MPSLASSATVLGVTPKRRAASALRPRRTFGFQCSGCAAVRPIIPAGYVVLEKPNKYGSFCEPKKGLPNTTPPAEAEKCKFGMFGTPPNDCHCPEGTEFQGYKGCVLELACCQVVGGSKPGPNVCSGAAGARRYARINADQNDVVGGEVLCGPYK